MIYDVVKRYVELSTADNLLDHRAVIQLIEKEIRLDEANVIERLLRDCGGLVSALAMLRRRLNALSR